MVFGCEALCDVPADGAELPAVDANAVEQREAVDEVFLSVGVTTGIELFV